MGGTPDGALIRVSGYPTADLPEKPVANYSFVSPHYFSTIGAPLQHGRDVRDADTLDSMPVTIVNSAMAEKYWPGEDPIGKQVGVDFGNFPMRTIIGVAGDIKQSSLREKPTPEMFVPYSQDDIKVFTSLRSMQYAVRAKSDSASITASVRRVVHGVDRDLSIANLRTLTSLVDDSTTTDRSSMILLGAFGVLALILASIGMYGVVSYSVMQRTQEIGVRIALGASRRQIFALVLQQGCRLIFSGITIGLIVAFLVTRLMARFLYGVQPTDLFTFAVVSFLLIAVVLFACYIPARTAMKVNPVIALRYE